MDLSISPNPSRSTINISFRVKDMEPLALAIYDTHGGVIYRRNLEKMKSGVVSVDLRNRRMPAGIYYVVIFSNTSSEMRKVVLL
jgi:hypothetical protein